MLFPDRRSTYRQKLKRRHEITDAFAVGVYGPAADDVLEDLEARDMAPLQARTFRGLGLELWRHGAASGRALPRREMGAPAKRSVSCWAFAGRAATALVIHCADDTHSRYGRRTTEICRRAVPPALPRCRAAGPWAASEPIWGKDVLLQAAARIKLIPCAKACDSTKNWREGTRHASGPAAGTRSTGGRPRGGKMLTRADLAAFCAHSPAQRRRI